MNKEEFHSLCKFSVKKNKLKKKLASSTAFLNCTHFFEVSSIIHSSTWNVTSHLHEQKKSWNLIVFLWLASHENHFSSNTHPFYFCDIYTFYLLACTVTAEYNISYTALRVCVCICREKAQLLDWQRALASCAVAAKSAGGLPFGRRASHFPTVGPDRASSEALLAHRTHPYFLVISLQADK